eukprot:gene17243-35624_t
MTACAQPGANPVAPPPVQLGLSFDSAMASALLVDGVNMVKGSAFMRQRGGGVVTCAGADVYLVPATPYAKRRITYLYGTEGPSGSNSRRADVRFEPEAPNYMTLVKRTKCDAQGSFAFDRVADGEFYVQTQVAWQVANRLQGGNLMHLVKVQGGQVIVDQGTRSYRCTYFPKDKQGIPQPCDSGALPSIQVQACNANQAELLAGATVNGLVASVERIEAVDGVQAV